MAVWAATAYLTLQVGSIILLTIHACLPTWLRRVKPVPLLQDAYAVSAEVTWHLSEDPDRIAQGMNDVVVRRIFAAGLDLQAALGLIGDQRVVGKIYHAIDELDHAIRDIRDTIFDRSPHDPPSFPRRGGAREAAW
jgi:hypothetical protein